MTMNDLLLALGLAVLCIAAWRIHWRLRRLETKADAEFIPGAASDKQLRWEPDYTVYRFTVPPPGGP